MRSAVSLLLGVVLSASIYWIVLSIRACPSPRAKVIVRQQPLWKETLDGFRKEQVLFAEDGTSCTIHVGASMLNVGDLLSCYWVPISNRREGK